MERDEEFEDLLNESFLKELEENPEELDEVLKKYLDR